MKKSRSHSLLAMLLVCVMAMSLLTACGGDDSGENTNAVTKEEYAAAVEKLGEDFASIQTDAVNIDATDLEAAKKLLEDCKAPLKEFMAIVPPEVYAEAHEKLKSGSQGLIDYLDTVIGMLDETDSAKLQEAAETMVEQVTKAAEDMAEGSALLEAAG